MHWFGIALLALILGYVSQYILPLIANRIPASISQKKVVGTFVAGAILLVGIFIAVWILSAVGVKTGASA